MYIEKKSYLCGDFCVRVYKMVVSNRHIVGRIMAIVMCLLAPFFSYAQAQYESLGTSVTNALAITNTVAATVADGTENYFQIDADYLPATVYYFPDSAFGPVPELISVIEQDTLRALMVSENCRMGWKWTLTEVQTEQGTQPVRYFYFSAHEDNAIAQISPTVCHTVEITLPDTAVCEMYIWGDTTIVDSGTYTRYYTVAGGCDSVVTQKVTINESSDWAVDVVTAYDNYTWLDGTTYTSSIVGPIYDELKNAAGCDSTVTLNLTIRHLETDTLRQTVCSNQLPYQWRGNSYSESGTYNTDTLLYAGAAISEPVDTVYALVLTVNKISTGEQNHTACDSYVWNGTTYTESGNYTFNTTNAAGCDSVATLHLIVNYSSSSEETHRAYDSYEWHGQTYTQSGDYTFRTTNAAGCDSVITLHLTIREHTIYDVTDIAYFCPGINTEHDKPINETQAIRYLPYVYEAPADWYKEGMILDEQHTGMMLDLSRAEENLRAHYVGNLEPIEQIAWSYRTHRTASYEPVYAEEEAQWLSTGDLMLNVYFLCGHEYRELLVIGSTEDMEQVNEQTEVRKVLRDGQLYIIRGNAKYTIFGTRIE